MTSAQQYLTWKAVQRNVQLLRSICVCVCVCYWMNLFIKHIKQHEALSSRTMVLETLPPHCHALKWHPMAVSYLMPALEATYCKGKSIFFSPENIIFSRDSIMKNSGSKITLCLCRYSREYGNTQSFWSKHQSGYYSLGQQFTCVVSCSGINRQTL